MDEVPPPQWSAGGGPFRIHRNGQRRQRWGEVSTAGGDEHLRTCIGNRNHRRRQTCLTAYSWKTVVEGNDAVTKKPVERPGGASGWRLLGSGTTHPALVLDPVVSRSVIDEPAPSVLLSSAECWLYVRLRCFVRGAGPATRTRHAASARPFPRTHAYAAGARPGGAGRRPSSDSPPDCVVSGGLSPVLGTAQYVPKRE